MERQQFVSAECFDFTSLEPSQSKDQAKKFYRSIRSEKARSLFSMMMRPYFQSVQVGHVHRDFFIGVSAYDKTELELGRLVGDEFEINGVCVLVIGANITPELARETIKSISVAGFVCATPAVWQALRDRIHSGIHIAI